MQHIMRKIFQLTVLFAFFNTSFAQLSKERIEISVGLNSSYFVDDRGALNYLRGAFESNRFEPDTGAIIPAFGIRYLHLFNNRMSAGMDINYNLINRLQHTYENNSLPMVPGGIQGEVFKYSNLRLCATGQYDFVNSGKLIPFFSVEMGYNLPFVKNYVYSYYRNNIQEALPCTVKNIKGGVTGGIGTGVMISNRLKIGLMYRFSQMKFDSEVTWANQGTTANILEKHKMNDHSVNFSLAYIIGGKSIPDSSAGYSETPANSSGFVVKAGTKFLVFTPEYYHIKVMLPGKSEVNRSWQYMTFYPKTPAYAAAFEYLFRSGHFGIGLGSEFNFPVTFESSFIKIAGVNTDETNNHVRTINKYYSIIPYVTGQYHFDTKFSPYFLADVGYSHNFFDSYKVTGSEEFNDITAPDSVKNTIYMAVGFGMTLSRQFGIELKYQRTNTGFRVEYNSLTAKGSLAYQGDKIMGKMTSVALFLYNKF